MSPNMKILLAATIATVATSVQIIAQPRPLEIDDFFSIKRVGNPRISPDKQWVAYTQSEFDEKKQSKTGIWMVPLQGGEPIPMTAKGTSSGNPRWSPDGKHLSFTASRNDSKNQVWGLNRQGGEARQLTFVKQGISGYEWSPDGSQLLVIIKEMTAADSAQKKDKDPAPVVIDRLQFKRDYVGYLDTLNTNLYLVKPGDTVLTQLTFGPYDVSQPTWSPDGRHIAFVSNRTENPDGNGNSNIWVVAIDKPGELQQVTSNPGADYGPAWSPDGKAIAHVSSVEPDLIWYATNHLAITTLGGQTELLTKDIDRNVSSPVFSSDGKTILFNLEDSGMRHLASIGTNGRRFTRLINGNISIRGHHTLDGLAATVLRRADAFGEIYLHDGNQNRQLTNANRSLLDSLQLSAVENIHFNSADGTEIEGFLYRPIDYVEGQSYPTLLHIHGGPVSQFDFSLNFVAQMMAANGYAVVMVNPRGSSGYGQDFSAALFADWGNKDFDDVMAGVDHVVRMGIADSSRLGVGGWSYGGILTNYVITKTGRFKAAISGASETLYRSLYGHDHYQYYWEKELGLPWENRELWDKLSPFNYVANVTTPTLFMGGSVDWNVPILGSEQMYQAMKRLGRTTQLVVYPGQHHGIRKAEFIKDRFERYLAWYGRFLK